MNKVKSWFASEPVNTGRQPELDLAKAFLIFNLAIVHLFVECTPPEGLATIGMPYYFDSVVGGPFGAPMFIFCMGVGLAYTKKNAPALVLKRGVRIFLLGIAHNTLRYLIPCLLGQWITGDSGQYADRMPYLFFGNDILQFAGLAMMLMGLLLAFRLTPVKCFLVGAVLHLAAFLIGSRDYGNQAVNVLLGHIVGTYSEKEEIVIYSDFPLLIWFSMYAFGYLFGYFLLRCKEKQKLYRLLGPISAVIVAAVSVVEVALRFGMMGGPGDNVFYHLTPPDMLVCILAAFFVLWLDDLLVRNVFSEKFIAYVGKLSKNITIVYFIQWVVVFWTADLVIYIVRGNQYLKDWQMLILGTALSVLSICLAGLWSKFITKKKAGKA